MLSRLTPLYIHLIGFFMALIVLGLLFMFVIKPKNEELQNVTSEVATTQTSGHGTKSEDDQHKKDVIKELADKAKTENDWQIASAQYMPTIHFANDVLPAYRDTVSKLPQQWGTWITSWYDVQRNQGIARLPGVEFPIASFPTDPNYVSTLTNITFPQGAPWTVSVEAKSFNQMMAHLRRFNTEMHKRGMPVINNVSLQGQSPHLIGTYQLALYIILPQKPPAADPKIGEEGAASGAAGGMGGLGSMGRFGGMGGAPGMGGPMGMPGGPGMMRPGAPGMGAAAGNPMMGGGLGGRRSRKEED